jgi:hypothetical protein
MNRIVRQMYAFQERNGTQGKCMDNAVFLKDTMTASGRHAQVQPVIATWTEGSDVKIMLHMVVLDAVQGLIDPSFEVARHQNVRYALAINGSLLGKGHLNTTGLSRRDAVVQFLKFIDDAKRINAGMILLSDPAYYNAQADFLGATRGSHPLYG